MATHTPTQAAFSPPTHDQWLALVEKDLKGSSFEKRLVTHLIEGLTISPLYATAQAPSPDVMGLPGQAPFARGSLTVPAHRAGWSIIGEHRHPLPAQANRSIRADLEHGAHGVCIRLSPRIFDESRRSSGCGCGGGVLVDSVDDLDLLLSDVDLSRTYITLAAGPAFLAASAQLMALLRRRGITDAQFQGQFGADPLGTLAARGQLPRNAQTMLDELGTLACTAADRFPGVRAITVSTAVYDHAGASATQELAAALATGLTYLRTMESAGLSPTQASRQLAFSLAIGADQFLEMAKLRALRVLYNRLLEVIGVPESDRCMLLHARTSRRILTQRDPWVNVLRTTVGCFAAALGGADQITVLPFDDVIGPSDAMAQRLARNTQIILQQEANLGRVVDAGGGSYYLEHLTLSLAEAAWKLFQDLEARGGMLQVLRDGSFAKEIEATATKRAKDIARRKVPITGVSEYPHLAEKPVVRAKIDTQSHEADLQQRRAARANDPTISAWLTQAASLSGTAQVQAWVSASESGATMHALQRALGSSAETVVALHLKRLAFAYEALRDQSDVFCAKHGHRPRIFSANMGPIATHTARASYALNFFEAGGFEILGSDGFADVAAAVNAFSQGGTQTVVICSSDTWYEQSVCELATALKQAGATCIVLAGNPGANEQRYRQAGIDRFIFIGCDVVSTLTELAESLEVTP